MSEIRDIRSIRADIDEIDRELAELLVRRLEAVRDIARSKEALGLAVSDYSREREVIENIRRVAGKDLADIIEPIFDKIMDMSRELQRKLIEQEGSCDSDL